VIERGHRRGLHIPTTAIALPLCSRAQHQLVRTHELKQKSSTMTDGQSASLSWCQDPSLGPVSRFVLLSDICGFVEGGGGAPSETRGLITVAVGPLQSSHSWVAVPRDSPHLEGQLRVTSPQHTQPKLSADCLRSPDMSLIENMSSIASTELFPSSGCCAVAWQWVCMSQH
jgi:hypothetical protein